MSLRAYGGLQHVPERVATFERTGQNIISFGRTNTYPQQVDLAIAKSGIASACLKLYASFLYGNGFAEGGDEIVNDKGQTANDVLRSVCASFAQNNGFALLLNINALGQYTSLECERFSYIRLGIPEDRKSGYFDCVYVSDDWAGESWRNDATQFEAVRRDLFNPSGIEEVLSQYDLSEYAGQVLYYTTNQGFYPKSPFDSVIEQILTTGAISEFDRQFVNNRFSASTVFVNEEVSPSEEEYMMNLEQVAKLGGVHNAGGISYLEGKINMLSPSVANMDKQYEVLKNGLKDDITEALNIPPVLLGRTRQGGFPNQEELVNAFAFYNGDLERQRMDICRQFDRINAVLETPILPDSQKFEIVPKEFVITEIPSNERTDSI